MLVAAAITTLSCSKYANDLVHKEVPAEFLYFEVEGQEYCNISRAQKTVTVYLPEDANLSTVIITELLLTEGAVSEPSLKVGMVIDLTSPLTVTLTTYDDYIWTIKASGEEPEPKDGPQLYNMGFDHWCVAKDKLGVKYDALYDEDASEEEKAVWGMASSSTKMLGYDTVLPETEFLAAYGEGKQALKLKTCGVSALFGAIKKLAAGSVFNGSVGNIELAKMSAHIFWGTPFTERPKALEGYYCYQPVPIDWVQAPYEDLKGQMDTGHVMVILSDWEAPYDVCPPDLLLNPETDPGVIGYGKVVFDESMIAYEPFHVDITYRSERTPKYITIVCSSSARGDYFTGGDGSVLYLDEFKLTY